MREQLNQMDMRIAAEQKKYAELTKAAGQKAEKAHGLEEGKWYPGKFLSSKAKKEQNLSAAEHEAEQAQALVRGCGAVLEEYNKNRAALATQYAEISAKVCPLVSPAPPHALPCPTTCPTTCS